MPITVPHWLEKYLNQSSILCTLVDWLQEGLSDEDIARRWRQSPHKICELRRQWHLYRNGEHP